MFAYCLASPGGPPAPFWRGALRAAELLLLLRAFLQIPAEAIAKTQAAGPADTPAPDASVCGAVREFLASPGARVAGVSHATMAGLAPLFLVYVALVFHGFKLEHIGAARARVGAAPRPARAGGGRPGLRRRLAGFLHHRRVGCSAASGHFLHFAVAGRPAVPAAAVEAELDALLAAAGEASPRCKLMHAAEEASSLLLTVQLRCGPGDPYPARRAAAALNACLRAGRSPPGALEVRGVEAGEPPKKDYYTATFFLDFLCFLALAALYPAAVIDRRALRGDSWVSASSIPRDYLLTLIVAFTSLVVDRVIWSVGSGFAKWLFHVLTVLLYAAYSMKLFWEGPRLEAGPAHLLDADKTVDSRILRAFVLLRLAASALAGLQTRHGQPAKKRAGGSFFMRRTDRVSWLGFLIVRTIPFLYELRCLLDWTSTRTCLDMFEFLTVSRCGRPGRGRRTDRKESSRSSGARSTTCP